MIKAFELDNTDSRVFMELDQLYKRLNFSHDERLKIMDENFNRINTRDDLYLEYITLLNQTQRYQEAKEMLDRRIFHPWEGGEGKVPAQYQISRIELAKLALKDKNYEVAIQLLNECLVYPSHLGEGKLTGAQENDFHYFIGCAYEGLGDMKKAVQYWELAKDGITEPVNAMYYNDQKPDKIFYQGLALLKLDKINEANYRFNRLLNYGESHLNDNIKIDYFAVSLPDLFIWEDDLNVRNRIHCKYMMALGKWGLGESENSKTLIKKAKSLDVNHLGIMSFENFMD